MLTLSVHRSWNRNIDVRNTLSSSGLIQLAKFEKYCMISIALIMAVLIVVLHCWPAWKWDNKIIRCRLHQCLQQAIGLGVFTVLCKHEKNWYSQTFNKFPIYVVCIIFCKHHFGLTIFCESMFWFELLIIWTFSFSPFLGGLVFWHQQQHYRHFR